MSVAQPGDRWSVGICDDLLLWEFASKAEFTAVTDRSSGVFRRLVASCDVPAMVTILDFETSIETAGIDRWNRACRIAAANGITRWAIVACPETAARLDGALETAGLETRTTDDRTAAIEWARSA